MAASSSDVRLPRRLPLLIIDNILFPGTSMRVPVSSQKGVSMIKNHLLNHHTIGGAFVGVVPREFSKKEGNAATGVLHHVGTAGLVVQVTGSSWPRSTYTLLVNGACRFRLDEIVHESPYLIGAVTQLDRLPGDVYSATSLDLEDPADFELSELLRELRSLASGLIERLDLNPGFTQKYKSLLNTVPSYCLPDICTSIIAATHEERLAVLDAVVLPDRIRLALPLLRRQLHVFDEGVTRRNSSTYGSRLLRNPRNRNASDFSVGSSNNRSSLTALIRNYDNDGVDDGDSVFGEDSGNELSALDKRLRAADLPEYARRIASKEMSRLRNMPIHMPEHAMTRSYLELLAELPWSRRSAERIDLQRSRAALDSDHYGMQKLKKRVLEYLAVRKLSSAMHVKNPQDTMNPTTESSSKFDGVVVSSACNTNQTHGPNRGPILCFVGPPGVGKTSVGRSIAKSLGREFYRISLGGVGDQADIRGHRRTYIGSMPGRIIQGLKTVGVKNPVFLLDEVDKMTIGIHGDPAAALLEVLDPEQNSCFTDHYMNIPFDLSEVLFIATANTTTTIPPALLDRMEVILVPGYTHEEKEHIAKKHLLPKQIERHGLHPSMFSLSQEALRKIISSYTREAGVRTLERRLGAVCRAAAVRIVESQQITGSSTSAATYEPSMVAPVLPAVATGSRKGSHVAIDLESLEEILGPPMFDIDIDKRLAQPGVAIGLAWTVAGGEVMFVEASKMIGSGRLTLTGQLGDVMKESATLALNWLRIHASKFDIERMDGERPTNDILEGNDIHIHFPAGAVEKDGPSAGVTIVCVLVSLFTRRIVASDVAMTGEITLQGLVLPVGGVKEKVLAAHRAGITRIILPEKNRRDLAEIPENVAQSVTFHLATRIEDVLQEAFVGGFPSLRSKATTIPTALERPPQQTALRCRI